MMVREIAAQTGIPSPYLSKIFQRLCDAGIVVTKRGYKGGAKLALPPEELTLLAIETAVETGRPEAIGESGQNSTRPNTFWQAFHKEYWEKLAAMTLADVLAYETQP